MAHSTSHNHDGAMSLDPYATRLRFSAGSPVSCVDWGELIGDFTRILTASCATEADSLIGHIKGFAHLPGGGHLRFSAISAKIEPDVEVSAGDTHTCREIKLDLNAHVYGLAGARLAELVDATATEIEKRQNSGSIAPSPHEQEPGNQSRLVIEHDHEGNTDE